MASNRKVVADVTNEHSPLIKPPQGRGRLIQAVDLDGSSSDLEVPETDSERRRETTNMQTLMHLIKGNVGTGILAMPVAFKHAGLWVGFMGILLLGLITSHCMHILVYCSHRLCKRTNNIALDYGGVMETCIKTGPMKFQKFTKLSKILVTIFLILGQFGFCCVYIVFISRNVKQFVKYSHKNDINININVYLAIVTALIIPSTFIKKLTILAPFSAFANLLTITGLVITFYSVLQDLPDVSERPFGKSFGTLPLFFGTAMFTFEGISCVLPLENRMKNPIDFRGWTGVLTLGMTIVTTGYTAMGFYGYLKYGETVQGSISLDLPKHGVYVYVRLMFAVALFISYLIQFYVLMTIIFPVVENTRLFKYNFMKRFGEYFVRVLLVLLSFGFGSLIPHLDLLISLIGAAASSSLAMIFPPIIEMVTFASEECGLSRRRFIKDMLIVSLGFLGFITGTYASLKAVINAFEKS